jgi:hypothetical protein
MKWLSSHRMRMVWLAVVVGVLAWARSARADFTFGEPINLGPTVNYMFNDGSASLSTNGLSLFFESDYPNGGYWNLFVVTRETIADPWGDRVKLGPTVNILNLNDWNPNISADGLELYFGRGDRAKGIQIDLWVTTRETTNDAWRTAVSLGEMVNSSAHEDEPAISGDGLTLYFSSDRPGGLGGTDLWMTTRPTKQGAWGDPVNLGPTINSANGDFAPTVTADGLTLIFSSDRPGKHSSVYDLWATTRRTPTDAWREPFNLGLMINTDDVDYADISPDGTMLYLSCYKRPGGYGIYDIWQASIEPIIDFNGDENVDIQDLLKLIQSWDENDPSVDIAPPPFGDGIVDEKDLEVLMSYWGQEIPSPFLAAHWKLDEVEGDIAYNSINDNHGILSGNPTWQPDGGHVVGALQFNGLDEYVSTNFVLNPADSEFSVFAWIKGGDPGQVILSQISGANWLSADLSEGNLMTEIVPPTARAPLPPLVSDTRITDGKWHHIGFVWSGAHRTLCVDGVVAAEDVQSNLAGSSNGLYIGTGNNLAEGTFFSGLIDDVRIYNKALSAEEITALAQ